MDAGREIDQDNRPANRAERWLIQSEMSLGVALAFIVVAVLLFAAVFVTTDLVVAVLTE